MIDEGRADEALEGLTPKQKNFAREYLKDFNASAAVNRSGYQTKYPNRVGSELLDNPAVKYYINQLTRERADKSDIKPEYVIKKVMRTIEKAERDGKHTAVLKGCELLARHLGMFIERTEVSGPNGDPIRYEQVKEEAQNFVTLLQQLIDKDDGKTIVELIDNE